MSAFGTSSSVDDREISRVSALMAQPNAIFVFGSNRRGVHGSGAARVAWKQYGAILGRGEGLQGHSYAIPTKYDVFDVLKLSEVAEHVATFLGFARAHPEMTFAVTRIGCGLAGFSDDQIAPLFADAPDNCQLPDGWRELGMPRGDRTAVTA